jgi:4-amino-4-deoxy-L-arabinose transferase-like glycosyltransferase
MEGDFRKTVLISVLLKSGYQAAPAVRKYAWSVFVSHKFHFLAVTGFAALLLFWNLDRGGLSGYDDALYAHEGKQLLISGDWSTIRFNGWVNPEYPPLFMWMEAVSMRFIGVSDFAAKTPAAISGLVVIAFVFLIARLLTDDFWIPIAAAWVLTLTQYFIKYAMHAMTDVPYTMFFVGALYCYLKASKSSSTWLLPCGIAIGMAVLTRSVIGGLALGICVLHMIIVRPRNLRWTEALALMIAPAVVVPSVWFLWQFRLHGSGFLTDHLRFLSHKIDSGSQFNLWRHVRGVLSYPMVLLRFYWPWLPLSLIGLVMQIRSVRQKRNSDATFLLLWIFIAVFPFALIDAVAPRYIMPALPALAILAATALQKKMLVATRPTLVVAFLLCCTTALGIVAFPHPKERASDMKLLGPVVDKWTAQNDRALLYTSGELQYGYANQLLWYGNRLLEHLAEPLVLQKTLMGSEERTLIIDRASYQALVEPKAIPARIVAEAPNFLCVRINGSKSVPTRE